MYLLRRKRIRRNTVPGSIDSVFTGFALKFVKTEVVLILEYCLKRNNFMVPIGGMPYNYTCTIKILSKTEVVSVPIDFDSNFTDFTAYDN